MNTQTNELTLSDFTHYCMSNNGQISISVDGEALEGRWHFLGTSDGWPSVTLPMFVSPVGAAVLKLLEGLPRIVGNDYVLPGSIEGGHFVGLPKVWRRMRARAGLRDVRLHDLRHSFASIGAAGGDSLFMIGKLLGHRQTGTTARYAHLAVDPLKAAADRISGTIAAAMRGNENGAEIAKLSKRGA